MFKFINQKGVALVPLLILLILFVGLILGVYLSGSTQIFSPKAFLENLKSDDLASLQVVIGSDQPKYINNRLIVEYKSDDSYRNFSINQSEDFTQILKQNGVLTDDNGNVRVEPLLDQQIESDLQSLSFRSENRSKFVRVNFTENVDLEQLRAQIEDKNVQISYEPVIEVMANTIVAGPNDHYYIRGFQPNMEMTSVKKAWEFIENKVSTGEIILDENRKVKIAIVDSGLNIENNRHVDLSHVNLLAGYNFITKNQNVEDELGHGTAVSGIVAANTNNQIGIAGYQWVEKPLFDISVYKIFGNTNEGSSFNTAQAIVKAARDGAKVINVSAGMAIDCDQVKFMQQAVDVATGQGAVVIASAGNNGSNIVATPASCKGVLSVGSVDKERFSSEFTNYDKDGSSKIKLSAPGEDIVSLVTPGCSSEWCQNLRGYEYGYFSGTSFAAPQVSAVAGILMYINPQLKVQDISNCLTLASNTDQGLVRDGTRTPAKILNVEKAVIGCYKTVNN